MSSLGIGDLIIDLDADIEKSSKIESSFISPLDPAVTNNKKTAAASKNIKEGIESEKGVLKKNLKGSYTCYTLNVSMKFIIFPISHIFDTLFNFFPSISTFLLSYYS